MGKYYPLLIGFFALVSSIFAAEALFCTLTAVFFLLSCIFCDSARPMIIVFSTFCFHISGKHSPSKTVSLYYGGDSSYLFTGWRVAFTVITVIFIVGGSCLFFIKNKCYKRISFKNGMLPPIIALCVSFLLGGVTKPWYFGGIWLALGEAAVFSLFYFLFAYGFREDESCEELARYFSYVSSVAAGVLICQLIYLFVRSELIFVNGGINKEGVMLGFGIWTLVGISLAVLIPGIFLGAMRSGTYAFCYFGVAVLTWLFAILTMSRGAQLFSTLAVVLCCAVGAFKSAHKRFYKAVCCIGLFLFLLLFVLFYDKIGEIATVFFDDNGRAEHAKIAVTNFLSSVIFGVGFSGFESILRLPYQYAPMGPLPAMAHNTLFQLMSATGIFGVVAYIWYRTASIVPVLKKPTLYRTLLLVGIAVILLASLVDNFIFDIYPAFYPLIALAIIHKTEPQ